MLWQINGLIGSTSNSYFKKTFGVVTMTRDQILNIIESLFTNDELTTEYLRGYNRALQNVIDEIDEAYEQYEDQLIDDYYKSNT